MKLLLCLLVNLIPLDATLLPGLTVSKQKEWVGEGLYGFMNGGSELYLEYGFETMVQQTVRFHDRDFEIEYYKMPSADQAYGIYSVHCFRCVRADSLTAVECYIPTYLQFQHGPLYVTITCAGRDDSWRQDMDALLQAIVQANPVEETPKVPDAGRRLTSGRDFFVTGDLGLSAANISWASYFEAFSGYNLWMHADEDNVFTGRVTFPSSTDANAFAQQESLTKEDALISVHPLDKQSFSVTEVHP